MSAFQQARAWARTQVPIGGVRRVYVKDEALWRDLLEGTLNELIARRIYVQYPEKPAIQLYNTRFLPPWSARVSA